MGRNLIIWKLKTEMEVQGVTMYRLAQLTGISQSSIGRILKGQNIPTIDTLERICEALDLEIEIKKK